MIFNLLDYNEIPKKTYKCKTLEISESQIKRCGCKLC